MSSENSGETLIANRYRLKSLLGKGGMGEVYEAGDTTLSDRTVALKIISLKTRDPEKSALNKKIFEKETKLLSTLKHPGIPAVYNSFVEDDKACLVMEFIEGQNLESVLKASESGISPDKIIQWGLEIAEILKYLHQNDPPIIFRDIKPANVILQDDGSLKIVDFGIARTFSGERQSTAIMTKGTLGYAPPEQFTEGEETDHRSDIYSLGATLHHLTTGEDPKKRPPFSFKPVGSYREDLPDALEAVISKCLQLDKKDRYQSIDQVIDDLKKAGKGKKLKSHPVGALTPAYIITLAISIIVVALSMGKIVYSTMLFYGGRIRAVNSDTLTMSSEPDMFALVSNTQNRVRLTFSSPMDTASVEKAMTVQDKPPKNLEWKDNDTVCDVYLKDPLPAGEDTAVIKILSGKAKDKRGRPLFVKNNRKYEFYRYYLGVILRTKNKGEK